MSSLTFPGRRSRCVGRGSSTDVPAAGWSGANGASLSRSPALLGGSERRPGA